MNVRVSIGLLAPRILNEETGEALFLGILAPSHYAKGNLVLQPLGGAAELSALGVVTLMERFGASEFHKNKEDGVDARFVVDESKLEDVMFFFENREGKYSEVHPGREIVEELAGHELPANDKLPEIRPALSSEAAGYIGVEFVRTVRQKWSDAPGTSTLARADTPSRRLFHLFELKMPQFAFDEIVRWPGARLLSTEEVATTGGGAHKGVSRDGITIADNFLW